MAAFAVLFRQNEGTKEIDTALGSVALRDVVRLVDPPAIVAPLRTARSDIGAQTTDRPPPVTTTVAT